MSQNFTATASAPANIAFIKYWGKKNKKLRLPANNSISMNLSGAQTITTVDFSSDYESDRLIINGLQADENEQQRVSSFLEKIRQLAKIQYFARVDSENTFPKGAGIASSASSFAALSLAATAALGLKLSEKELSQLARLGSGSACRSIPDGFVEWVTADTQQKSFAHSLYPADYWKIADLVVIVTHPEKDVSSSMGHDVAPSSPFFQTRLEQYLPEATNILKSALKEKNFSIFGQIIEAETINFHAIALTSQPSIMYWNANTITVMQKVKELRESGLEVYFTIDAGPNLHLIVEQTNIERLKQELEKLKDIKQIIVSYPDNGARLISK